MKKIFVFILFFFSVLNSIGQSLAPAKLWDKTFGGTSSDILSCFLPLSDGTFLAGGTSYSEIGGDKTQASQGAPDFWIIKIDAYGNKIWDKDFGGSGVDELFSMLELNNGKIILIGFSNSPISGDKSEANFGGDDYWIVEIDGNGNKIWDKTFGGNYNDEAFNATQATDNSIFITGYSNSDAGGNKTSISYGTFDTWIIKIDTSGNLFSQFSIGGIYDDYGLGIVFSDDGFIYTSVETQNSISGNITSTSFGGKDYLIYKLDQQLNIIWQKRFGGDSFESRPYIGCARNKISVCGWSESYGISGNKTVNNHNNSEDLWNVILDSSGSCISQRAYGGFDSEDLMGNLFVTKEKNLLIAGNSYSGIGGDKTQNNLGIEQTWVALFDTLNNLLWDRTVLDSSHDETGFCTQLKNSFYILGNCSKANIGGDKTQDSWNNSYDYFMICLGNCEDILNDSVIVNGDSLTTQLTGATYQWYNCDSSMNISGATQQTFVATEDGNYAVWITDGEGCTKQSDCIYVDVLGINNEPSINNQIKIYPNPASSELTIFSSHQSINTIAVFDLMGREMLRQAQHDSREIIINLKSFSPGVYFIKLQLHDGSWEVRRFVKE